MGVGSDRFHDPDSAVFAASRRHSVKSLGGVRGRSGSGSKRRARRQGLMGGVRRYSARSSRRAWLARSVARPSRLDLTFPPARMIPTSRVASRWDGQNGPRFAQSLRRSSATARWPRPPQCVKMVSGNVFESGPSRKRKSLWAFIGSAAEWQIVFAPRICRTCHAHKRGPCGSRPARRDRSRYSVGVVRDESARPSEK